MSKDKKLKNKDNSNSNSNNNSDSNIDSDNSNILSCLKKEKDGIKLFITVKAQAKVNSIEEVVEDRLKIKISSPPIDGKANEEIIKYLSKVLDMKKSDIKITLGLSSKIKTILLNTYDITKINSYLLKEMK